MKPQAEILTPTQLLNLRMDMLSGACDQLATALLFGDQEPGNDPYSRMAHSILSNVLMDYALHAKNAKERMPCDQSR